MKSAWFNEGFQEEDLPTEPPNLEAFKNTDNLDKEEHEDTESVPTPETELESESGAKLGSGRNAELESESCRIMTGVIF